MNIDEHHVALPKLYGAPAYARPPRVFDESERPPDPDDLPLEVYRADDWPTSPTTEASLFSGDVELSGPSGSMPDAMGTVEPVAIVAADAGGGEPDGSAPAARGADTLSGADAPDEPGLRPRPFSVRGLKEILHRR